MDDLAQLILKSSLGTEMTAEEAGKLADLMAVRDLKDGEHLTTEGTTDDSLHLLLLGKLEVVKYAGAGDPASLAILREGDMAGELSFIDGTPHVVGLRALCDSRVVSLKRQDFEALVGDDSLTVYKVMRAIVRSAHRVLSRMNFEFVELSNYIFKQHGRY